jgi:hypothetical protein
VGTVVLLAEGRELLVPPAASVRRRAREGDVVLERVDERAREGGGVRVQVRTGSDGELREGFPGKMSFQAGGELLPVRVAKVPAERDLSVDDGDVEGDSDGGVVGAVAWERGAFDEVGGESFGCKDEVERRPGVVRGRVERGSPFLHKLTEIIDGHHGD